MFLLDMISCACGTMIGLLLAEAIVQYEQRKNSANIFTFSDDTEDWDELEKRVLDIRDNLNGKMLIRFVIEILTISNIEDGNKICEKYEKELEELNNKEK